MPYIEFDACRHWGTEEEHWTRECVHVYGPLEAETLKDFLEAYAILPLHHPVHGEKNILHLDGVMIVPGGISGVRVLDHPPPSQALWATYNN
jgi:hypothetical protein